MKRPYDFAKSQSSLRDSFKHVKNHKMKTGLIMALVIVVPLHTYAQSDISVDFDCSDYFGLNICGDGFEFSGDQNAYVEENSNTLTTKMETIGQVFDTSLTNEDMNQIERENVFKNSDSFRAYMKTISSTDSTNTNSEFSVRKRILDNKNFDLDCRLVTSTIYELSSSNYYDCALQRNF